VARMQRTQIYLEPELAQSLDRLAGQRGTSRAELIREAARQLPAQQETPEEDSILGLIGIGRSGRSDVSERHDDYLIEDTLDEMRQ
jgi:metal-responsive CopG/Arc/MetJ family transcriptional regulator